MNNRKIYFLIIIFFIATLWFNFFYKQDEAGENKELVFATSTQFSRLSFFNASEAKASLDIPEEWEGEYRAQEKGRIFYFYSIINPQEPIELFRISYFDVDAWQKESRNWEFLEENSGKIFAYQLSTAQVETDENRKKYNKMLIQSREILESFESNKK